MPLLGTFETMSVPELLQWIGSKGTLWKFANTVDCLVRDYFAIKEGGKVCAFLGMGSSCVVPV